MTPKVAQPPAGNVRAVMAEVIDHINGWTRLAAFLGANQQIITGRARVTSGAVRAEAPDADPLPFLSEVARAAVEAGATITPFHGTYYGGFDAHFGPACLHVYADLEKVYARQVVGTVDKIEYAPLFSIPSQDGEGEK